jgi:uncharacterized membrane protein YdjX (TVP38/TMEM64 family)
MKRHIKKVIILLLLFFTIAVLFHFFIRDYFTLDMIKKHKEFLQSIVAYNYTIASLCYVALYACAVIFLLPFVSLLSMLGGFLFGPVKGTLFIMAGATMGVTILIALMRSFLKSKGQGNYGLSFAHFNSMIVRHGISYLLCIRLIFVIPFFVVNSFLAFTTIPLRTIAWTTFEGIIPASLLFASAGSQLEQINHVSDLLSFKIILIFGLLALFSLAPILLKRAHIIS